jgi:hypothetical protein
MELCAENLFLIKALNVSDYILPLDLFVFRDYACYTLMTEK